MSTITPLAAWLRAATIAERELLARAAGTSVAYLNHLAASEDKNYRREPKASLAAAIERETIAMHRASKARLPVVYRTDLNGTCRQCEFAKRCLGDDTVVRSEFAVVGGSPVGA